MIPTGLTLEAFGPFIEKQTIDFEALGRHGLFVIHGPTGSGKSTILDAVTYALFGESSGDERKADDVIALDRGEWETRVELVFEHMGRSYRIERAPRQTRPKKRGSGTTVSQPVALLYELRDGAEELLEDGPRNVDAAVETMLMCDVKQFRQTVVLPQGDFRRVLTDAGTRETTLKQLFDTQRFADVEDRVKRHARQLRDEVASLISDRDELLERHEVERVPELEEARNSAKARRSEAETLRNERLQKRDEAITAVTNGETLAGRFSSLRASDEAIAKLADEAEEIASLRDRLAAHARAEKAAPQIEVWNAAVAARDTSRGAREKAQEAFEKATAELEDAHKQHEEHQSEREAIAEARQSQADLRGIRDDVGKLSEAAQKFEEADKEWQIARDAVGKLQERIGETETELSQARARAEGLRPEAEARHERESAKASAEQRVRDRRKIDEVRAGVAVVDAPDPRALETLLDPFALALSARLDPGSPCPVCGAAHAHDPSEHARAEADAAAWSALSSYEKERTEQVEAAASAKAAVEAIIEHHAWDADQLPSLHDLETEAQEIAAALARSVEAHSEFEAMQVRAEELEKGREQARRDLTEASGAEAKASAARTSRLAIRDDLLERVPEAWRDPEAFEAELTKLDERLRIFDARTEELQELAKRASEQRASTKATLDAAIERAEETEAALAKADTNMQTALTAAAFVDEDGDADIGAFEDARLSDEDQDALSLHIETHHDARRSAETQRKNLLDEIADRSEPDLEALEAARQEASEAWKEADEAFSEASETFRRIDEDLTQVNKLETRLADREGKQRTAQHLSDVLNGERKGEIRLGLEQYVLRRILDAVLANANRELERMTGRYRLRVTERDAASTQSLDLDVEDNQAGLALRKATTLSGGEGFQASLALALGLSEAAERTSGAVELGALFIDEGFGSLDSDALRKVTQVLRRLPEVQNRMVGVITHVDALKEQLEAKLIVERTEVGSRVVQDVE